MYKRRRASLQPGYSEYSTDNDLFYTDPSPGFYMFSTTLYAPPLPSGFVVTNHFLVVVEGTMTNTDIKTLVVQPLKTKVLTMTLPDNTAVEKVDAPTAELKVGSRFDVKITPSAATKSWWRGYKAETDYGNALFMESSVDATTELATLTFLARRPGSDSIYITLYGPNLDSAFRAVGVLIVA